MRRPLLATSCRTFTAIAASLFVAGAALATAPSLASHPSSSIRPPAVAPGWHCTAQDCGQSASLSHFAGFAAATLGAAWCSRRAR